MALAKRTPSQMAHSMKLARQRATQVAKSRTHSMLATGTAGALGFAAGKGMALPTVGDLDAPTTYGLAALAATFVLKGKTQQHAQSMADGLLSVAAFNYGQKAGAKARK